MLASGSHLDKSGSFGRGSKRLERGSNAARTRLERGSKRLERGSNVARSRCFQFWAAEKKSWPRNEKVGNGREKLATERKNMQRAIKNIGIT